MKLAHLERFAAVVDAGMHAPRAADAIGVPLASVYTAIDKLEEEVGHPLLVRTSTPWTLTPAGALLLEEARVRIADAPDRTPAVRPAGGGKARASKGKGRAPAVKGQPKPYKKRQGR